jgi:hypothetical protein
MNIIIKIYSLVPKHKTLFLEKKYFITKSLMVRFAKFLEKIMTIMHTCLLMVTKNMNLAKSTRGRLV